MPQIAADLGVDFVLEGTVRWSGGGGQGSRIRITPSLIDVSRDEQLWSDSYDEVLEEVFAVQSRVAEQVIRELNLTLGDSALQAIETRPTDNLDAYRLYLQGIESQTHSYYSPEHRLETITLFQRAVELDPKFALAWAALSSEHSYFYHLRFDTTDDRRRAARQAVDRALELDPDLAEAHLALGKYHYRCHRDYEKALQEFSIVQRSLPNDAEVLASIGAVQRRLGKFVESAQTSERVIRLKPLDSNTRWDLGVTYATMGDTTTAFARLDESIAIAPSESAPYCLKSLYTWISTGDLKAARAIVDAIPTEGGDFETWIRYNQFVFERDYEAALRLMDEYPRPAIEHVTFHGPKALMVGDMHRLMGNTDQAQKSYGEALASVQESLETRGEDARIHAVHGQVLARLGRRDEAIAAGLRAVELYPASLDAFHGPYMELALAQIYSMVGDTEKGFDGIEALLRGPQKAVISLPMIRLYPIFDTFRDHPRYLQLESEFGQGSLSN